MKKFGKILVSAALTATMVLSSTFGVAANPAPSILTGVNTVTNPVFAVLLPTAPAIRLNPFQIGVENGAPLPQISSPWNVIANRSNVPVSVIVRVAPATLQIATPAPARPAAAFHPDVTAMQAADTATRPAFLELEWAAGHGVMPAAATNTATAAILAGNDMDWTECDEDTGSTAKVAIINPFKNSEGTPADIPLHVIPTVVGAVNATLVNTDPTVADNGHPFRVLLDAHEVNPTTGLVVPASRMTRYQIAAYRFGGALDYDVTWVAGQVNARVIFTITGISNATYDEVVENAGDQLAHRVFAAPIS